MSIYFTEPSFDELVFNPFDYHERYTPNWIMLKLLEAAPFKQFTGGGQNGIFQLIITKKNIDWQYRIFDFIQYETACGNHMIIAVNQPDYEAAKQTYGAHCYQDRFLRFYEKRILMHTTTTVNYKQIQSDGCLQSWNQLKRENRISDDKPIGSFLGDPPDYSNYIMFNNGGYSAERVISSRQKGYIEMDVDKEYTAGARLYFDGERIAKDGLLVRDGAHLKVKECLPLNNYLLWVATPEVVNISQKTTPRTFAEKSDMMFSSIFGIKL